MNVCVCMYISEWERESEKWWAWSFLFMYSVWRVKRKKNKKIQFIFSSSIGSVRRFEKTKIEQLKKGFEWINLKWHLDKIESASPLKEILHKRQFLSAIMVYFVSIILRYFLSLLDWIKTMSDVFQVLISLVEICWILWD